MTMIITRSSQFEIRTIIFSSVIIHHIHNHSDSGIMKSLHHLLHLAHTSGRVGRISGIRTLRSIVIQRIISPIISVCPEIGLVNRIIIIRREDMHMSHTKLLEMVDTCLLALRRSGAGFGEGKEFTLVRYSGRGVHRHIAMMHLIHNHVREILHLRTLILIPTGRVGGIEIDDSRTLAIHANSLCPNARSLIEPFVIMLDAESIELAVKLFRHGSVPCAGGRLIFHVESGVRSAGVAVVVEIHHRLVSAGAPETEMSDVVLHGQFEVFSIICRPSKKLSVIIALS